MCTFAFGKVNCEVLIIHVSVCGILVYPNDSSTIHPMIGHPEVSRVRHQLFVMVWTHFIHDFSITIQIRWICHLAVNQLLLAMAQFFTWRDSTAVVPHVKFCSDNSIRIWMRAKWNFHNIGIVIENCWRNGSLVGFIHKFILEPVSLRFFFPSQFKIDGNFVSLSPRF